MTKRMGLTLIEFAVVMIFFGILVAVTVPKLIELSSKSQIGTAHVLAGLWSVAGAKNYVAAKDKSSGIIRISDGDFCDIKLYKALVDDDFPRQGYIIGGHVPNCTIKPKGGADIVVTILATP